MDHIPLTIDECLWWGLCEKMLNEFKHCNMGVFIIPWQDYSDMRCDKILLDNSTQILSLNLILKGEKSAALEI